jgi:hypothetical protein
MKVYWSARRGVVVTSANLSTNAYGRGDLREFGVHLPSRAVDIDKIIRSISAVPATPETVDKLERDRRKLIARGPDTRRGLPTFVDWYDERTRTLDWSIITYEGSVRASRELRAVAKRDRPDGGLENWVTFARGEIAEDDYLLTIDTTGDRLTDADWMYVHRIVGVGRNDPTYDRHLRYQAGQVYPSRTCRPPPFRIDDRFRRALREAPRTLKPPLAETLLWLRGRPPLGLLRALRGLY